MKPVVAILVILLLFGAACAASGTTPATTSPTATTPVTTSPTATLATTTARTFGQLAQAGQGVYNTSAASCHGAGGQGAMGPGLWGPSANLARYGSAANLLDYIAATMPLGAAGSLSHQDYLEVLCFILVQNNEVAAETPFDEKALSGITLK